MKWNVRGLGLGPYDLPSPGAPRHIQVRYAIYRHRVEEVRSPLRMTHVDA